jgi:uridine monophosphate synthetase
MSFFSVLEARARAVDSLLCVGLDPHPQLLRTPTAEAAQDFCQGIITQTQHVACAYKPNAAFFEAYGAAGWGALKAVIAAVPDEIPVLLDAKRGDIASTGEAYARAIFDELDADAVTLNPYLGFDSIQPFLERKERGIFLLCKTSNPGADDLQGLRLASGVRLYQHVIKLARDWNRHGILGLVVGATDVEALRQARVAAPNLWILAPGVGAQGGDLQAALAAGLREDRLGLLLPISRGIASADDPREAAESYCRQIQQARARWVTSSADEPLTSDPLADALLEAGCVQFGDFTLKSGKRSPIYFDLRRLISSPRLLERVAAAYLPLLAALAYDRIAGIPYAGLPIATAISLLNGSPMIYPRKEVKAYGTRASVEGDYHAGDRVVLVDDLATTGGSKFEAIERLENEGLHILDVVVLIDREGVADSELASAGYKLHSVYKLSALIDYWERSGRISAEQAEVVGVFLKED